MNSQNTYEFKITIDEENNELIRELKGLSKGDLNSLIKDALKTQIELKKNKKIRPHFKNHRRCDGNSQKSDYEQSSSSLHQLQSLIADKNEIINFKVYLHFGRKLER